jgi:hypothetical protein
MDTANLTKVFFRLDPTRWHGIGSAPARRAAIDK